MDNAKAPADYLAVRDACYERKRKDGELTEKDKEDCKRMASIWYYKKHGKPVQHEEGITEVDLLEIIEEQLDYFGSFAEHERWNNE